MSRWGVSPATQVRRKGEDRLPTTAPQGSLFPTLRGHRLLPETAQHSSLPHGNTASPTLSAASHKIPQGGSHSNIIMLLVSALLGRGRRFEFHSLGEEAEWRGRAEMQRVRAVPRVNKGQTSVAGTGPRWLGRGSWLFLSWDLPSAADTFGPKD